MGKSKEQCNKDAHPSCTATQSVHMFNCSSHNYQEQPLNSGSEVRFQRPLCSRSTKKRKASKHRNGWLASKTLTASALHRRCSRPSLRILWPHSTLHGGPSTWAPDPQQTRSSRMGEGRQRPGELALTTAEEEQMKRVKRAIRGPLPLASPPFPDAPKGTSES